jgi:NAD(P)-dependent dehydrogenase (short-subunit alcohol dehydrogenase family)
MTKGASAKIALITGANRGIGFQTACELASKGWCVVIGARKPEAGQAAVQKITNEGGRADFLLLDVADSESITRAAAGFSKMSEHLDVLINNAGIYRDEGLNILTVNSQQLATTFQTNTFGAVAVTQAFLPFLRKSKTARVLNVSSGYGQLEGLSANVPAYCLSKLTLNGVTIMLSSALQTDRISVNSVCPGWVRTDMGGAECAPLGGAGRRYNRVACHRGPAGRNGQVFPGPQEHPLVRSTFKELRTCKHPIHY